MPIKNNPAPKTLITKSAPPKLPQGRPPSGSTQFRGSASSYGKLAKLAMPKNLIPPAKKS